MQPTDPIALLKKDHREIKHLFKEFEKADGRSYPRISNEVFELLEAHNEVEESIFYPMIRAVLPDEFIVEEGLEEHHVIRMLINELKAMDEMDIHFEAKFKVLSENCEHHFEEEEEKMFPKASKLEDDLRASIAEAMQIKKEELLAAASA
jgi:hemerythrin superfamily protein